MLKRIAIALLMMFTCSQAFAEFDVRLNYAMLAAPKSFNSETDKLIAGYPALKAPSDLGLDVVFVMPIMPVEFGARYEMINTGTASAIGVDAKFEATRVSLLGGYRFINTLAYFGVLAHLGVSNSGTYTQTSGGTTTKYTAKFGPSYGLGVEGGAKIAMLIVGGEIGYTALKATTLTDPTGSKVTTSTGSDLALDLSGPYVRISAGVNF